MTWARLQNFGHLIFAVGDGTKRQTTTGLNTLSAANCEKAVTLTQHDPDAVLFIAGANGREHGPRPNRIHGALPEAERMRFYIRNHLSLCIPILTDCDAEFRELTALAPSFNTRDNSRNAAALVSLNTQFRSDTKIVAERLHLPRVIGTFRKALSDHGFLRETNMQAYPVDAPFDPESCQLHLRSEIYFRCWETYARLYSLILGHVLRKEFLREWITRRNFSYLHNEHTVPTASS